MISFSGMGVALVTPFNSNGSVDYNSLYALVTSLSNKGVDYWVVLGTTAESSTLTAQEKAQVLQTVIESNHKNLPIVLGAGGNDTRALCEQLKTQDLRGVDALLSVVPYYNKPTQEGLYQHFAAVAKSTELPILLYNVPSRSGVGLAVDTIVRLANDFDTIIGIKEASGDLVYLTDLMSRVPADFIVTSGDDFTAIPAIYLGASGVISVIGQGVPELYSSGIHAALNRDISAANKVHRSIQHFSRLVFEQGNPSGIKACLTIQGLIENQLRLPLIPVSESLKQGIETELKNLEK
ncbi:MAG: 4-hydroxy-tetrahydrodipicolinate synthase [Bacteroidetes bacterium]|nr:4-hydroxy-tetrahydrodipicolinate synthase [Bacteroidota bacterium]MDA0843658.1 4-hydroxy-tetrahydrodipicolinate synthase [Bacteroidota bacterium]